MLSYLAESIIQWSFFFFFRFFSFFSFLHIFRGAKVFIVCHRLCASKADIDVAFAVNDDIVL